MFWEGTACSRARFGNQRLHAEAFGAVVQQIADAVQADIRILTRAPGDGNPIGGIKVIAENGWFAARPSGTEDVYKIYAESFRGRDHLKRIQEEAQSMVAGVLGGDRLLTRAVR